MDISRHRYFYDRIAENEMNDRNRDEIRRRMIPFPYIDSVMVRQNSDSVSGHDYIYNYAVSYTHLDVYKRQGFCLYHDYRMSRYGMASCL